MGPSIPKNYIYLQDGSCKTMQTKKYTLRSNSMQYLKKKITNEIENINTNPAILRSVRQHFLQTVEIRKERCGGHFEDFFNSFSYKDALGNNSGNRECFSFIIYWDVVVSVLLFWRQKATPISVVSSHNIELSQGSEITNVTSI